VDRRTIFLDEIEAKNKPNVQDFWWLKWDDLMRKRITNSWGKVMLSSVTISLNMI